MEKLTLDTSGFTYPCFPPKEQLKAVAASGNFHKILGVPIAYSDYVLPQFWAKCKTLHPDHDFFCPIRPNWISSIFYLSISMEMEAVHTARIPF